MYDGRPLGTRNRIRLLIGIMFVVWATQTLLQQWGWGQQTPPPVRFVPHEGNVGGGTLELRSEATVIGSEVTVRQICRWSDADAEAFAPIANLVLMRLSPEAPYRTISLDEIRSTLHDAGVNLGRIRFVGAMTCTVSRRDVHFDEGEALQRWIAAREVATTPSEDAVAAAEPAPEAPQAARPVTRARQASHPVVAEAPAVSPQYAVPAERPVFRRLRDVLIEALAQETGVAADQLVVDFSPRDDHLLNLIEPHFRFHATLTRGQSLGRVSWDVIIDANGETQRARITGTARAWQQQLVVTKPIAFKQIIREEDVIDRRTLVDHIGDSPLLRPEQAIGQMAAMDLKPGTVLTSRMVDAVPLVRPGQLVTVSLQSGSVEIRTVARAMQSGTYGQTVRVRNEATRDVFDVTMVGPQQAIMGPADGSDPQLASMRD